MVSALFGCLFTISAAYGFGAVFLRSLPLPRVVVLATGSALLGVLVFFLFAAGVAGTHTFLAVGLILPAAACWRFAKGKAEVHPAQSPLAGPLEPASKGILAVILGVYGVFYGVHALAPEVQPDAVGYHLGIVSESLKLGSFPPQIGFYEMLPQGLGMLFSFAFAFGQHSAAKLIHFVFLAATFPLMMAVGQRLGLAPAVSGAAAVFYLLSPVVGTSGTSAYNDAALVFFTLAAFYTAIAWKQEGDDRYLLPTGILAGFCYAIKMTGLLVPGLAVLYVLSRRRWRGALLLAAGAALVIAPWMVRSAVATGNPVFPFFNRVFENPYFHVSEERDLLAWLRDYRGVALESTPLELTVRGHRLQGLTGPWLLLAPFGLLALRFQAGRVAGVMGALMAVPWYLNVGTRFLMPALPWIAFLLAFSIPRVLLLPTAVLHAVLCWPTVLALYAEPGAWRLDGFPLRAALRIQPEDEYLRENLWEFRLAELLDAHIAPGARVLDLFGGPRAYTERELVVYWQSAEGKRLSEALHMAALQTPGLLNNIRADWPEQPLTALRAERTGDFPASWAVHEVQLRRDGTLVRAGRRWLAGAWPNVWEAPFAFDRNLASRWSTRRPAPSGTYLQVEFGEPLRVTSATLVVQPGGSSSGVKFHGRLPDGKWILLSSEPSSEPHREVNLRGAAVRFARRHGIGYVLAPAGELGHAVTGASMLRDRSDWGVEHIASLDHLHLFRVGER